MSEYFIPTGYAEAEFTEKRSRFIGYIWQVGSEEEARARIEETKKKHYDARHNCWCYRLHDGPERYSDDGEPQGTAGQPMLGVFQREGVENVCCVVTRYFGGVLLGTGGLLRAYTKAAKDALAEAGVSEVRRWAEVAVSCPYPLFERMKQEVASVDGVLGETEYGADVRLNALLPAENWETFAARIIEVTGGQLEAELLGERNQAVSK